MKHVLKVYLIFMFCRTNQFKTKTSLFNNENNVFDLHRSSVTVGPHLLPYWVKAAESSSH